MSIKELEELSRDLSILYVEDDVDTAKVINSILKELFKEVVYAKDGKEALDIYKKSSFDIILSDIKMPNIDGLEMSELIKQKDREQNIIILTAYEESRFYSRAIEIGVDSFILKPVKTEQLVESLYKTSKRIKEAKEAKFYREYLEQRVKEEVAKSRKKDKLAIEMLNTLLDAYPNPTILYDSENRVKFVNESFKSLFEFEIDSSFKLSQIFIESRKLKNRAKDLSKDEDSNCVLIKTKRGKKIFMVTLKDISIEKKINRLYSLTDVTSFQRQKLEIKQLNLALKRYIVSQDKKEERVEELSSKEKLNIDDEAKRILHKNHKIKIDAKSFIQEIERENIEDLDEIEDRFSELLDSFEIVKYDVNLKNLQHLSSKFELFSMAINRFIDFADIAYAIQSLALFLGNLTEQDIKDGDLKLSIEYLNSILKDFQKWIDTIFIQKSAVDIHYMDSSLFSGCLQVELDFFNKESDDSDDDIIMF